MSRNWLWVLTWLMAGIASAQTAPSSDPQAVTLAAQSIAALTGGSVVSDVTLNGTATRIAGSDRQSGSVTFLAKGLSESRMDVKLSGGTRSEIRNVNGGLGQGNWIGPDDTVHPIALHNCFTDASWFFPGLSSLAAVGTNDNVVLTYAGLEKSQQTSLQHIHAYAYDTRLPDAQQLSATDFYLDPQTLLPIIITFNEHPDNDGSVNIAVKVMFSDYRNVDGATIPFRIQRYVNDGLMLDVQITSAKVNSGISDSTFIVQ